MLTREEILERIDAIYAARARSEKDSLATLWTADATFQLVGEASILKTMPVTPQRAQTSVSHMIDTFTFHSIERISATVEGLRAAVVMRLVVSAKASSIRREMLLHDIWELDEQGRAKSLMQFSDTALVAAMLAEQ